MPYNPGIPPQVSSDDAKALVIYLEDELKSLASSQVSNVVSLPLVPVFTAPKRPRTGTIVYADGIKWNPGSGEGAYEYGSDGAWHFLQNTSPAVYSSMIGVIEFWPTTVLQAGRLKANGNSVLRATFPILLAYLVRSGSATFTNGSSSVGMAAHNLSVSDPIKLFTAGTLPTNFTAGTHGLVTVGTNYFVKSVVDSNTVTLASSVSGAAISAGSAGSGTHTWVNAPHGDGDGSTTFTLPNLNGSFPRVWDDSVGVDVNRSIGSLQLDAFQGHVHTLQGSESPTYTGGSLYPAYIDVLNARANNTTAPISDGTNGTPRTSTETRPRNVSLMATIRYSA